MSLQSLPRPSKRILVTGATGFVGSHVINVLRARGHHVVGGARDPEKARAHRRGVTFCHIDLANRASVSRALALVDSAIYLVHGMANARSYGDVERGYAETFRDAAAARGLERIVYLGGPPPHGRPSPHLQSRLVTGEILRSGPTPVVELQATMIVGGGSESFRIVRDLAARLPAMLLPRWLDSVSEPVGIDDVGGAIEHAIAMPLASSEVLAVPGPEVMSGRAMIERTARALGNAPVMIDVPLVTPRLSSYWIRLVTRADPRVATALVEGLRSDIVASGPTIWERMPAYRRTPFDEAVRRALAEEDRALPRRARVLERVLHPWARGLRPDARVPHAS